MGLILSLTACAPSENPTTEDLIKTAIPSFSGGQSAAYTTTTAKFTLYGECDIISKGIEWSYDNTNWNNLSTGCLNGGFKIDVVVSKFRNIYVRAITKMGRTEAAIAQVRFVLPPTTPAFQVVSAGSAIESDEPGVQFTMSGTTTGHVMASNDHQLDLHMTGIVYGD